MVIEANPAPFSAFKQTATVTTNANGSYSATVKPLVITRYRAIKKRTSTGSFATIARTRLLDDGTARSRYRRTVRIRRSGVYRVSVSSNDSDHLSGVSRMRRITVH